MTELERLQEENAHLRKLWLDKDAALQEALQKIEQLESKKALPLLPEELVPYKEQVDQWITYKKQRGQGYKPLGLKALYAKMIKLLSDGVNLEEAVNSSIANNYAGLFAAKQGSFKPRTTAEMIQNIKDGAF